MQDEVRNRETAPWSPDTFVRLANQHGKTEDAQLADEAGVSPEQIRNIYEGGMIAEHVADGIAPLIGLTPVTLLTCANAYAVAAQLATGELTLREAFDDARIIRGRYESHTADRASLPAAEERLCSDTLAMMEDVVEKDLELRRENRKLWPGVETSWVFGASLSEPAEAPPGSSEAVNAAANANVATAG